LGVSSKPVDHLPREAIQQVKKIVRQFDWSHIGQFQDEALSQGTLVYWKAMADGKAPQYAYTCARNRVCKVIKDAVRGFNNSGDHRAHKAGHPDAPIEETDMARWKVAKKAVGKAIGDLPWIAQACLSLQTLKGFSAPRIAAALNIDETTVRRCLKSSKGKLRAAVEDAWEKEAIY
jgi:DNA-directed RNA polymerase specialized sigma24 family protein